MGILCVLYIDDTHNGQLRGPLHKGQYAAIESDNKRKFSAAKSAVFLVAFHLICLGYFLGLSNFILTLRRWSRILADSSKKVFHLIPEKKQKFVDLIREASNCRFVSVKTLQHLIGKCVWFCLAVPAVRLFTREMSAAVSKGMRMLKPIAIQGALRNEIARWLFLERWGDPLHWHEEEHLQVNIATDASWTGWGAHISTPVGQETSVY